MKNTKNNVISNENYELDMKLEKHVKSICEKYDLVYERVYDECGEFGFDIYSTKKRSFKNVANYKRAKKEIDRLWAIYHCVKYGVIALPTFLAE